MIRAHSFIDGQKIILQGGSATGKGASDFLLTIDKRTDLSNVDWTYEELLDMTPGFLLVPEAGESGKITTAS